VTWKPDYTTSSAVKSYLRISDTDDDAQIAIYITAASRAIDRFVGRQFGVVASAEDRVFLGQYDPYLGQTVYEIDDIQSITGLTVTDADGVAVAADADTGYELWPLNAIQHGRPYTQLRVAGYTGRLTIHGLWGWTAIPTEVVNATLIQVSRLAARRDSPFGVAGSPTEGSELRLLSKLDPDVMVILDDLKRRWWAA